MKYVFRSTGEIVNSKQVTIDGITYPEQAYASLVELIPLKDRPSYDWNTQKAVKLEEGYEENGEWVLWTVEDLTEEELLERTLSLRAANYPSIGDQLDALFHAGVFPSYMASKIQAVKDKYPK